MNDELTDENTEERGSIMSWTRLMVVTLVGLTMGTGLLFSEEISKKAAVEATLAQLEGGPSQQAAALKAVGDFEWQDVQTYKVVDLLAGKLKGDEGTPMKMGIVDCMARLAVKGDEVSKKAIVKTLIDIVHNGDANPNIRLRAVVGLKDLVDRNSYEGKELYGYYDKLFADDSTAPVLKNAIMEVGGGTPGAVLDLVISQNAVERKAAINSLIIKVAREKYRISGKNVADWMDLAVSDKTDIEMRVDLLNLIGAVIGYGADVQGLTQTVAKIVKNSKDVTIIETTIRVAGKSGEPELIKLLVQVWNDNKGKAEAGPAILRRAVCEAAGEYIGPMGQSNRLGEFRNWMEKVSEMLVDALTNDADNSVSLTAAIALGNMESKRYDRRKPVAALIESLADRDESVKQGCLASLKIVTWQDFGYDIPSWRTWYHDNENQLKASP